MIELLFFLWVFSALLILREKQVTKTIIYYSVFTLISSICFLLLAAPDVAMAEAIISAFTTVFFIICFEKYFDLAAIQALAPKIKTIIFPLILSVSLFGLFIYFLPGGEVNSYLQNLYISRFQTDVGGINAVTTIYLAYRVYDTLFEALMLVLAILAVIHLSFFSEKDSVKVKRPSKVKSSDMAGFCIRILCPAILLFGVYLTLNGHISPGGGFQGGVAVASFFICRYLVHDIYDVPVDAVHRIGEATFIAIILMAIFIVFMAAYTFMPLDAIPFLQEIYLLVMNALIGMKVACGFTVLFYRYIVIERN